MASATKQDLTAAEFASLCEVGQVLVRRIVPKKHEERLVQLGLIDHTRGGLVQTPRGRLIARDHICTEPRRVHAEG
jgi:hypothetical protein